MRDPFGLRRVISPPGAMPQAADRLDTSLPLADDELEIAVEHLNIDAASFRQLEGECDHAPERIAARIREIVRARGKMHNPVTGSGGMLIGRVIAIGPHHPAAARVKRGDRIATLVSLTLTPLELETITAIHPHAERVDVKGRAILFASGPFAVLPDDLPEELSLAVLDVCGAPAWTTRLAASGMTVLVIGGGKSGALACAAAKERVGPRGRVLVLDIAPDGPRRLLEADLADAALVADATRPVDVLREVERATDGRLCDLVINCASVPGTEMGAVLAARQGGEVLYFSMATSFTAAALGAEGLGRDVRLTIGNGFAQGHADLALGLLRRTPALQALFLRRVSN